MLTRTEERILSHILDLVTMSSALAGAVAVAAQSVQNREQKLQILNDLEKVTGLTDKIMAGIALTAEGHG